MTDDEAAKILAAIAEEEDLTDAFAVMCWIPACPVLLDARQVSFGRAT